MADHEDSRHNLRLPRDLKARLSHARIDSGRSMNAEIVARLERSFDPDPAQQMMEAFRPVASLSDDDRKQLGILLAGIGAIFAGKRK